VIFRRENDQWKRRLCDSRFAGMVEASDADKPVISAAQKWLAGIDAENYSQAGGASADFRSPHARAMDFRE